jgi:hypothetical protein
MTKLYISFEIEPGAAGREFDDEQEAVKPLFSRFVGELQKLSAKIITQPEEWESYGWYVQVGTGAAKLNCMMQRSDQWLLMVFAERSLMDRLKGRKFEAEIEWLAGLVADAAHKAFDVPRPSVLSEEEFRGLSISTA